MTHLQQEFHKLSFREVLLYILAVVCQFASITAIFIGVFIAPKGEVHTSILTYFGISCGFCGSILGISTHYSNELTKFKATIMDKLEKNENID